MAAKTQANRSAARDAATQTTTTASTGKSRPAPREAEGTDANQATEAVAPTPIVVIAPNPKLKGSKSHGFYEKYGPICQMTDADACKNRGVRGKDLTWDAARRHILAGEEALNFPLDGSKEDQAKYLMSLNPPVEEKTLIKWGYLPQPEVAKEKEAENA